MKALSMTGTFSKAPRAFGFEDELAVESGAGAYIRLNDGSQLLDFVCGLGANLLGYGNREFTQRVIRQVALGGGFSLPHVLEQQVAEKLVNLLGTRVPGWTPDTISVRFAKTGSDANSMAVRLARAVTGRDIFCHNGYGGWGAEFIAMTPPALGIPHNYKKDAFTFDFNAPSSLNAFSFRDDLAAVMLEQGIVEPRVDWYEFLRTFCNKTGALLILDEVVTGLRYGLGGVAEKYQIKPDIITMGKALGNGFPISVVVGRKEYMDWFSRTNPIFCSSTHWGEAVSLAAADAMLDIWNQQEVDYIWDIGEQLITEIGGAVDETGWKIVGHPPRSLMVFQDDYERAFFIHGMRDRGILINRPNFICSAHTSRDVEKTAAAVFELAEERKTLDKKELMNLVEGSLPHILFTNR